jgi:hypothetical protein
VTAYKREGIPAFKGGHNQRLATSSKRKAAMAAFDEALATSRTVVDSREMDTTLQRGRGIAPSFV